MENGTTIHMTPSLSTDQSLALSRHLARVFDITETNAQEVVKQFNATLSPENGLASAALELYRATLEVSDDPRIEAAQENLKPFLNLL